MKNLIITGCTGQLGTALNRLFEGNEEYHLVNTDVVDKEGVTRLDITKVEDVVALAKEVQPYAIINCAAFTAVDAAEQKLDLCYQINAIGARNMAIAANAVGAKLVHISTDYVFPGTSERPLTEFDPTGPKSVYGITKLAGENFVRTMLKLSETHDKLTVVSDQFGSPTSAKELAKAIAYLLPTDNYGLFHGTCEGSTSWDVFAREIFRLAGKNTEVISVTSEEYAAMNPQSAPRPHYSILDNYMFRLTTDHVYADWQTALYDYMEEQGYLAGQEKA